MNCMRRTIDGGSATCRNCIGGDRIHRQFGCSGLKPMRLLAFLLTKDSEGAVCSEFFCRSGHWLGHGVATDDWRATVHQSSAVWLK